MYPHDYEFIEIFLACTNFSSTEYFRYNGYLFKGKRLCVFKCFIRDLLLREVHEGGLMGTLGFKRPFTLCMNNFIGLT